MAVKTNHNSYFTRTLIASSYALLIASIYSRRDMSVLRTLSLKHPCHSTINTSFVDTAITTNNNYTLSQQLKKNLYIKWSLTILNLSCCSALEIAINLITAHHDNDMSFKRFFLIEKEF